MTTTTFATLRLERGLIFTLDAIGAPQRGQLSA